VAESWSDEKKTRRNPVGNKLRSVQPEWRGSGNPARHGIVKKRRRAAKQTRERGRLARIVLFLRAGRPRSIFIRDRPMSGNLARHGRFILAKVRF
jgi:hypothetical protein